MAEACKIVQLYQCNTCAKYLKSFRLLKQHQRLFPLCGLQAYANNHNKFQCDICDQAFTSREALELHKQQITVDASTDFRLCPNLKPPKQNVLKFACDVENCFKEYTTQKALRKHAIIHHLCLHRCEICLKCFCSNF